MTSFESQSVQWKQQLAAKMSLDQLACIVVYINLVGPKTCIWGKFGISTIFTVVMHFELSWHVTLAVLDVAAFKHRRYSSYSRMYSFRMYSFIWVIELDLLQRHAPCLAKIPIVSSLARYAINLTAAVYLVTYVHKDPLWAYRHSRFRETKNRLEFFSFKNWQLRCYEEFRMKWGCDARKVSHQKVRAGKA